MRKVRLFLVVWRGHLLLVVTAGSLLVGGWFAFEAMRATSAQTVWNNFVPAAVFIFAGVVCGVINTYIWNTRQQRITIRFVSKPMKATKHPQVGRRTTIQ